MERDIADNSVRATRDDRNKKTESGQRGHHSPQELTSKSYLLRHRLRLFNIWSSHPHYTRFWHVDTIARTCETKSLDATQDGPSHRSNKAKIQDEDKEKRDDEESTSDKELTESGRSQQNRRGRMDRIYQKKHKRRRRKDAISQYSMLDGSTKENKVEIGNENRLTPRRKINKKSSKMASRSQHRDKNKQKSWQAREKMGG